MFIVRRRSLKKVEQDDKMTLCARTVLWHLPTESAREEPEVLPSTPGSVVLLSISSTFYEQLLRAQIPKSAKKDSFLHFWDLHLQKLSVNMLMKLTPAGKCDVEEVRIISEFPKCKRNVFLKVIPSEAKFLRRSHFLRLSRKSCKNFFFRYSAVNVIKDNRISRLL